MSGNGGELLQKNFAGWIAAYNNVPLVSNALPDQFLVRELDNIDCTFLSSDYLRATDSVNMLSKFDTSSPDMLYREFYLPSGKGTLI